MDSRQQASISGKDSDSLDIESSNQYSISPDFDQLEQEYDDLKTSEIIAPHISNGHNSIGSSPRYQNHLYEDRNLDSIIDSSSSGVKSSNQKGPLGEVTIQQIYSHDTVRVPNYQETVVDAKQLYDQKFRSHLTLSSAGNYLTSLFPLLKWAHHYNFNWLYNDLVAGITVGCVLVPQSMSYAQIASLPAQYGLYSSFVGAFIYSFFATSKDVCIGPVAVMSLETAKVIARVLDKVGDDNAEITAPIIATTLSLICGGVALGVGLLRLGFLVEFISLTAVAGFMTGSSINIISGQVPGLMGYSKLVNTRTATYEVIINSLKHLPDTKLDAVFGLIPLFILYFWKYFCGTLGPKLVDRYVARSDTKKAAAYKLVLFYFQALRNAFVIVIFTLISWGITRHKASEDYPISLLGTVPSGLNNVGVMKLPDGLVSHIAPELPSAVIILVLEHIAISKAFGRVNGYKVVPDQELIAIGVTNLVSTFFNAYPATGSFSRSALKAKCNVKTPFSGIFTGACVLLSLYCLTDAFYFIPKATLSAIIIHAVSDLVASYKTTWNFWLMNPLDFVCFIVTVFITIFSSIENGIYFAVCWSCAMLILKVVFPTGQFLGYVEICEVNNAEVAEHADRIVVTEGSEAKAFDDGANIKNKGDDSSSGSSTTSQLSYHTKWLPLNNEYQRELNPEVVVQPPPPGVIVFRPSESWTYVNCSRQYDMIFDKVKETTRPGRLVRHLSKHEKMWNDPGEWEPPFIVKKLFKLKKKHDAESVRVVDDRPVLKILAMDWSQVAQTDSTGIQNLVDLRQAINKYANRQVEFHFSGIISPWTKRALINAGFGTVNEEFSDESIILGHTSYSLVKNKSALTDPETGLADSTAVHTALGVNLPFFHLEMPDFHKWNL
ncbi:unnamed protein product [Kluyveromyces dobzhanskii CBS 2104]|uniref:WGS project CCBQ000000000 data, contig 00058 n=1 Tax=Kluyveromyces dobzhanskii CBS 2104 TaxID=1427455 RepID=A0A0A8LBL0_9SACH|nr:unnamed protein product [Kluyveromyces dobzhanskii CBS 2104]